MICTVDRGETVYQCLSRSASDTTGSVNQPTQEHEASAGSQECATVNQCLSTSASDTTSTVSQPTQEHEAAFTGSQKSKVLRRIGHSSLSSSTASTLSTLPDDDADYEERSVKPISGPENSKK